MVFNSFIFIIFFTLICIIMALTNIQKIKEIFGIQRLIAYRQTVLLVASYVFYGWWDVRCCLIMLGLTFTAYICAKAYRNDEIQKIFCIIGVIVPLIVLGIFKYFNFFVSPFCTIFGFSDMGIIRLLLPVGISFYTFQSLSYTVDVYRKQLSAEKSFIKVALYIAFFPQLVAGPIVKSKDFLPQLYENRNINVNNFFRGIQIFTFGLFKKIVIADNISVFVDDVFTCPKEYHAVSILLAVFAYSIQIYFDFSGYSDMAIGCASCLGYELRKNFNLPYLSESVVEFWKRWHISLSSWLQEYLYIPLGGNRKGVLRTYLNNFLTMLIGGLWHGASWTFVLWGALHGVALCCCKFFRKLRFKHSKNSSLSKSIPLKVFSTVITYLFVCFCWIFFRAENFKTAWNIIVGIFIWQRGVIQISTWAILGIIVTIISYIVAILKCKKNNTEKIDGFYPVLNLNTIGGLTLFFVILGLTLGLAYTGTNPFIYFQF